MTTLMCFRRRGMLTRFGLVLMIFIELVVASPQECRTSMLGTEYRGTKAVTEGGVLCQRWDSQKPHSHAIDVHSFPEDYNAENYCRNPDNEPRGPWCYTTDPDLRWAYCGVPSCKECTNHQLGVDYRGFKDTTISGVICQDWLSPLPHKHDMNNVTRYPDAVYNDFNFCRNPDRSPSGPWCYTMDPSVRRERCGIPICPECRNTVTGLQYQGTQATTETGRTCQRWDAQQPHRHDNNDTVKYPGAVYNEENYCRNPDNSQYGPWCYTTDPDVRREYCGVPVCQDCRKDKSGLDYRGNVSVTKSGRTCQSWASQSPHKHSEHDISKFPDARYNTENFCRNPDRSPGGPWCYTTDPSVPREYCHVPYCMECRTTMLGKEYRGFDIRTETGLFCQDWSSQFPQRHLRNNATKFPQAVYNTKNYCRNPDDVPEGPWCYTTHPRIRWQICDIPFCSDNSLFPIITRKDEDKNIVLRCVLNSSSILTNEHVEYDWELSRRTLASDTFDKHSNTLNLPYTEQTTVDEIQCMIKEADSPLRISPPVHVFTKEYASYGMSRSCLLFPRSASEVHTLSMSVIGQWLPIECDVTWSMSLSKLEGKGQITCSRNDNTSDIICTPETVSWQSPDELQINAVTADTPGRYDVTVECNGMVVYPPRLHICVFDVPETPGISRAANSTGEILHCTSKSKSLYQFEDKLNFNWMINDKIVEYNATADPQSAPPVGVIYGDHLEFLYIAKGRENDVHNVTCTAAEDGSTLRTSSTLEMLFVVDYKVTATLTAMFLILIVVFIVGVICYFKRSRTIVNLDQIGEPSPANNPTTWSAEDAEVVKLLRSSESKSTSKDPATSPKSEMPNIL